MNLREIAAALELTPLACAEYLDQEVAGCYAGDLLSCAMKGARHGDLWLTVQSHANVVAVAVLLELAGVVVTEDTVVDRATRERATAEGVVLLTSPKPTFPLAGRLWEMGIRAGE
ncbi:MAG: serine kinase [Chloroflexota bacterium]